MRISNKWQPRLDSVIRAQSCTVVLVIFRCLATVFALFHQIIVTIFWIVCRALIITLLPPSQLFAFVLKLLITRECVFYLFLINFHYCQNSRVSVNSSGIFRSQHVFFFYVCQYTGPPIYSSIYPSICPFSHQSMRLALLLFGCLSSNLYVCLIVFVTVCQDISLTL